MITEHCGIEFSLGLNVIFGDLSFIDEVRDATIDFFTDHEKVPRPKNPRLYVSKITLKIDRLMSSVIFVKMDSPKIPRFILYVARRIVMFAVRQFHQVVVATNDTRFMKSVWKHKDPFDLVVYIHALPNGELKSFLTFEDVEEYLYHADQ